MFINKSVVTRFKKKLLIFMMSSLSFVSGSTFAQSSSDISSLTSVLTAIRASIDGIVYTAATYIFQTPPNLTNAITANSALSTALQTVPPSVLNLNNTDIQNGLVPDSKTLTQNITQMATLQASDTILPMATVGGIPLPFFSSSVSNQQQSQLAQGNQNFNFQSLISPTVYSTASTSSSNASGITTPPPYSQDLALNYIRTISGFANPISTINLSSYSESQLSTKQKLDIQNSSNYQTYALQRRQLIAQQSAALTVLYNIYSKRLQDPNIKMTDTPLTPDPNNPTPNPSPAQLEDYVANSRTNSSNSATWYAQMATASETNVQREILFVLAEMQAELHRIHIANEHMLALTAINLLNGIQTGKTTLALTASKVQDDINDKLKSNATSGSTQQTPSSTSQSATQQSTQQQLQSTKDQSKAQSKAAAAQQQAEQNISNVEQKEAGK